MDIKDARKQIDTIDAQLVNLFEQRYLSLNQLVNIRMNIIYH